jgi:3-oxoacyl-[acyl-carrier protein] reductase
MLKDKIIIVTGGNRGIGKTIVEKLASHGAKVYSFDIVVPENIADTFDKNLISNIRFCKVNVTDFESISGAISEINKIDGRVDILVNNAGITKDNLIIRMSENDWDAVIDINLKGTFLCCKAVAKTMMSQRSGKIINIGSIVGTIGNAGQTNYASSKAGVIGLTKSLARELSSRNILVNCIAPGYVHTEMTDKLNAEQKEYFVKNIPLGRVAEPEEIADVAVFLASSASNYMTGQVLHVDGGLYM